MSRIFKCEKCEYEDADVFYIETTVGHDERLDCKCKRCKYPWSEDVSHRKIETQKNYIIGQEVTVYDRYRFAVPIIGIIEKFSESNDGVCVNFSNENPNVMKYSPCWVHLAQIR